MRPLISKFGDVSLALDRLRKGGSKDSWLNSGTTRVIGALECLSTIRNPNVMPIELICCIWGKVDWCYISNKKMYLQIAVSV